VRAWVTSSIVVPLETKEAVELFVEVAWVTSSIVVPLETKEAVELFVEVLDLQNQGRNPEAYNALLLAQNIAISKVCFRNLSAKWHF